MKQIQDEKIDELKGHFRGDVLLPGDEGYEGEVVVLAKVVCGQRTFLLQGVVGQRPSGASA